MSVVSQVSGVGVVVLSVVTFMLLVVMERESNMLTSQAWTHGLIHARMVTMATPARFNVSSSYRDRALTGPWLPVQRHANTRTHTHTASLSHAHRHRRKVSSDGQDSNTRFVNRTEQNEFLTTISEQCPPIMMHCRTPHRR